MSLHWTVVTRIDDLDGLFYVSIETNDGLFRFVKHKKFTDTVNGQTSSHFSPIYYSVSMTLRRKLNGRRYSNCPGIPTKIQTETLSPSPFGMAVKSATIRL